MGRSATAGQARADGADGSSTDRGTDRGTDRATAGTAGSPIVGQGSAVRVGLLGCGNVGSVVASMLTTRAEEIAARTGVHLELAGIAVLDLRRPRPQAAGVDPARFTDDAKALVESSEVDVVVELIGGLDPARTLVEAALRSGKPVVTGNKVLMSHAGAELADVASAHGVDLLYEAAVAGAIPVIRPLRESLAGERVLRVMGIVNGTTNYILTRMSEAGLGFEAALLEAQQLGYAEREPSADLDGHDAAAKAAILASLAFGVEVRGSDVAREGIRRLDAADVAYARRLGQEVRLLAIAERVAPGPPPVVSVRVHPALVPRSHPLASVRDVNNAVFLEGAAVGELMLYGRGAGGDPTAAAVLGDLIDAAHNHGGGRPGRLAPHQPVRLQPLAERRVAIYVGLEVQDQAGVLASVAAVFGRHGVSIRSMEQIGLGEGARLAFLTHEAGEQDVAATLAELAALDAVNRVGAPLRALGPVG